MCSFFVYLLRIKYFFSHKGHSAVRGYFFMETGFISRVAGCAANLFHPKDNRVIITVRKHFLDDLDMSGSAPLVP